MSNNAHGVNLSTHKGFIVLVGFGVVSLYFLWGIYGGVPLPLGNEEGEKEHAAETEEETPTMHNITMHGMPGMEMPMPTTREGRKAMAEMEDMGATGMAAHGVGGGPSANEFRRLTETFIAASELADGSVRPDRDSQARFRALAKMDGEDDVGGENAAIDVYLTAYQWGYEPDVIRVKAGQPYTFRMMALDATHGASINFGRASRMIRLRTGAVNEQTLTFSNPGDQLVYCTVYCGVAHDTMQAKIIVE